MGVVEVDNLSKDIQNATKEKIKQLELIRGKEVTIPFWDVVVLSALDEAQKTLYEIQLSEKMARNELPKTTTYHVFHDPVGVKVGNGGGVISVMDDLEKIYHDKLSMLKVLILLSGGYSQRLPSASLLGKVFTSLPLGNPIYQMIEFKLAMYIQFPQRMKPGIFVSSSDCIELYELNGEEWNFNNPGVTSLAHPSPIEIGTTHGVYVLDEPVEEIVKEATSKNSDSTKCCAFMGKCRRFLHKPSKEVMRSSEAVFRKDNEEFVYSDSAYYMDMPTSLLLLDWYRNRGGVQCEIDAYGDFLQALGPEADTEYCKNTKNVTILLPDLVKTREEIFHVLRYTQLNVLMLNKSKFYHIGTTKEYVENFCQDKLFRNETCFASKAMVKSQKPLQDIKDDNVYIHSFIESTKGIGENVIIEYTSLNLENDIGNGSIINNNVFPVGVIVPENSFLHTVVIRDEGEPMYVTIAFGTEDNLKKCCNKKNELGSLKYAGLNLDDALDKLNLFHDPWAEDCELLNLWHAKLFPAFADPKEALRNAAAMLHACRTNSQYKCTGKKAIYSCNYSMGDILRLKDISGFLKMRSNLRQRLEEA